jgi:hypothetical protein
VVFFRYMTPEGAGVRACQQAAADAVKAGRDGATAQKTCEDRGARSSEAGQMNSDASGPSTIPRKNPARDATTCRLDPAYRKATMADMTAAPRPNDQRDGEHETSLHDVAFPAGSRYTRLRWLGKWQTSIGGRRP